MSAVLLAEQGMLERLHNLRVLVLGELQTHALGKYYEPRQFKFFNKLSIWKSVAFAKNDHFSA